MKTYSNSSRIVAILAATLLSTSSHAEEEISLFNGKDLSGWTYQLSKRNVPMEKVWSAGDGILRCKGRPSGYLRTERDDFQDYKLTLQWRWPEKPGNNGVLVHASTPKELGVWPKSLEVQLGHPNAGDFWVIGTQIDVPDEDKRVSGRRHINLTNDSERPLGQWNQMQILCEGDEVTVHVNGDLVNQGSNCTVTKGAICLQSEGAVIEYRKIVLTPLERKQEE